MMGLAQAFRANGIGRLWYYVHTEKLPSIFEHGILSRNLAKSLGIQFKDISSPSAQRRRARILVAGRSLHDYVPLFMNEENRMYEELRRRIGQFLACVLVLIDVADREGVYFTDGTLGWQERTRSIYSKPEEVEKLPLLDIFSKSRSDKFARSAEVLVLDKVELNYLRRVFVADPKATGLPTPPPGITYHGLW